MVRAAQGGSEEAFAELFRHHWGRAHRAAYLVVRDRAAIAPLIHGGFASGLPGLWRQ